MGNDIIYSALGIVLESLRPFLVKVIQKHFPNEPWEGVFFSRLTPQKQETWNQASLQGTSPENRIDYHNLSFLSTKFRDELGVELKDKQKTFTFDNIMRELQETRNKCQHYTPLTEDEKDRAFSNMIAIANMLGMTDLRQEIDRLQNKQNNAAAIVPKAAPVTPAAQPTATVDFVDNNEPLKPWFTNCLPHYDIRNGVLDESVFAANLNEVAMGTGPEVYNNPSTFFAKTYVTAGLRDIANRVVRALNGKETENRVISLQTGLWW
jgi:hypothetical protein